VEATKDGQHFWLNVFTSNYNRQQSEYRNFFPNASIKNIIIIDTSMFRRAIVARIWDITS